MFETLKRKRLKISSSTKKKKLKNDSNIAPIHKLPKDMLCEILARVAASSRINIFNAKLSCSVFNEMGNEDFVYRHMSLAQTTPPEWMQPEVYSLFQRCKESGNPEAFYIQGLSLFLKDPEGEAGLALLRKAASSGHAGASYVLGVDRICKGERREGMKLLGNIKTGEALRECRADLMVQRQRVWSNEVRWSVEAKLEECPAARKILPAWPLLESDEDKMKCRICRWNLEIHYVSCILRQDSSMEGFHRCERIID